jgi:hypothetical protein
VSVNIFISCVSDEFRGCREQLRNDLEHHNVHVKVQEGFKDYGVATLEKLDIYIRSCDLVVHLVGGMTGAAAGPESTRVILEKCPGIAERFPPLGEALAEGEAISYTQWEAWLALYYGKRLLIAQAKEAAPRETTYAATGESRAAQRAHLDRLRAVEHFPGCEFASCDELVTYLTPSRCTEGGTHCCRWDLCSMASLSIPKRRNTGGFMCCYCGQ